MNIILNISLPEHVDDITLGIYKNEKTAYFEIASNECSEKVTFNLPIETVRDEYVFQKVLGDACDSLNNIINDSKPF